ncbi:MAG: M1 family peptidase, partial [Gemmatimonadota bacterium]
MRAALVVGTLFWAMSMAAPAAAQQQTFTHADTLRGSLTAPERTWWDVTFYDLRVAVSPADSSIRGSNGITYRVLAPAHEMQIDLMTPLVVDSMIQDGTPVSYRRDGNAFFATLTEPQPVGAIRTIKVFYHGKPQVARMP